MRRLSRFVRRQFIRVAAACLASFAMGGIAVAIWIAWPLPASILARGRPQGVTIEDRHGLTLRSTRSADGSNASWVSYDRIDADLINAFVAVEDRRFWDHHGIDLRAGARALRDNLRARRVLSGASTITMQLARLMQSPERSWGGKMAQGLWALRLEAHLGKQQILEQYLNRVQLGQGTVGVGAASALYFGQSASELSIGQAATLAGLAHAPSRDNPHVSLEQARARRTLALRRMRRLSLVTREDAVRARLETLASGSRAAPFLAPHFTTHVLAWSADSGRDATVLTSLDLDLQSVVEGEVRHTVDVMRDRDVKQAAAVVLDNASGEVLAWVGSPDFWASEDGQTDMVVSARQPGSALKPFLYGLALDRGITAATILPDIPKSYATTTGPYSPRNYDRRFRGPVRVREALASSYNVPAVEVASRVGATSLLRTLHLAGFESLHHDATYYGLGLALGNGDVTLIELANGYRALANGGEWRPWTWHVGHTNADPASPSTRRVVSPMASAIVLDILQDRAARIPGFGVSTPFDFPFPVAIKTGTSRHFTDNWAVATTRGFTVAVWAGNFNGRPMEGVSGVSGAGPLLHRVVMATAQRVAPGRLTTAAEAGAVAVPVCRLSGLRATRRCAQLTEWFAPGSVPTHVDDWERGGRVVLPDEYAAWKQTGLQTASDGPGFVAVADDDQETGPDTASGIPQRKKSDSTPAGFRILSPLDGDRYSIPAGIEARYATISLRAAGADNVTWSIDGRAYAAERWKLAGGEHFIEAMAPGGKTARVRIVVSP